MPASSASVSIESSSRGRVESSRTPSSSSCSRRLSGDIRTRAAVAVVGVFMWCILLNSCQQGY